MAPINAVEKSCRGVCTVIVPNVEGYIGWVSRERGREGGGANECMRKDPEPSIHHEGHGPPQTNAPMRDKARNRFQTAQGWIDATA